MPSHRHEAPGVAATPSSAVAAAVAVTASPSSDASPVGHLHDHDILTTAGGSRRLSTFVDFMRAAGLSGLLEGSGRFTVFAPTNRAFSNISLRDRDALLADRVRLTKVMRGHIVPGRVPPPQPGTPSVVKTIDGRARTLRSTDGTYRVDDARLIQTSIRASNGMIHAIDLVLL